MNQERPPRHYTREPWWVIVVAAIAAGVVPLWKYGAMQRANTKGYCLPVVLGGCAAFGAIAATILLARSHVRSPFWSNVVLWIGILFAALVLACLFMVLED